MARYTRRRLFIRRRATQRNVSNSEVPHKEKLKKLGQTHKLCGFCAPQCCPRGYKLLSLLCNFRYAYGVYVCDIPKACLSKICRLSNKRWADRMQIRYKIMKELKLAHERSAKVYNTRSRDIKFNIRQVAYRRNFRQTSQVGRCNAKLAPKQVKCIILKVIGNAMYELGDVSGKKIGIYHTKDIFAGKKSKDTYLFVFRDLSCLVLMYVCA